MDNKLRKSGCYLCALTKLNNCNSRSKLRNISILDFRVTFNGNNYIYFKNLLFKNLYY